MGFADVENSNESIMLDSQRYRFGEGWMATVNALGLPKDSPFKDLNQIPLHEHLRPPPTYTLTLNEEEDSLSMRELVEEIDSYTEVINLDIPTNSGATEGQEPPAPLLNPDPLTTTYSSQAYPRSRNLDTMYSCFCYVFHIL